MEFAPAAMIKSTVTTGRGITEQEIVSYHEKGVVFCPGLLPIDVVSQWANAWFRLKEEISSGLTRITRSNRFIGGGPLPEPLESAYRYRTLVDAATRVIGPNVALYMNRLLVKDSEWDGNVTPHQDCVYFHGFTNKLSAFVPLAEFSLRTGAVVFIEGSHKYGNLGSRGNLLYDEWPAMPALVPEAYPGDVIFASFETWHHSTTATVPSERPLMQITYQDAADGSYFVPTAPDGTYFGDEPKPVLVAGEWRTNHFSRFLHGIDAT
jgi:Phytanoyl-CoA dioxygenase (PhyH)